MKYASRLTSYSARARARRRMIIINNCDFLSVATCVILFIIITSNTVDGWVICWSLIVAGNIYASTVRSFIAKNDNPSSDVTKRAFWWRHQVGSSFFWRAGARSEEKSERNKPQRRRYECLWHINCMFNQPGKETNDEQTPGVIMLPRL